MSFWLEDGNGTWLGDLTNRGAVDIGDDENAPESLRQFMRNGSADEDLVQKIIEELQDTNKYSYMLHMFNVAAAYPVIITDGAEAALPEEEDTTDYTVYNVDDVE